LLGLNTVSPTSPLARGFASKQLGGASKPLACGEVKLGGKLMKYAIFEDGGKQYKAVEGTTVEVDLYASEVGEQIDLDRVLFVADGDQIAIGTPTVSGAKIQATVLEHVKGPKIVVFKYKPKKHYRVKTGHRQKYTRLMIDSIIVE
jgi:large subunit ribosomal protein L21